jgi:sugar/nucleoside kinase (ribokinase family)
MTKNMERTYLLVGTVTKDLLPDNSFTTGGTVTYAATIAEKLGWQPVIVTRATPEFTRPPYLHNTTWHILPASEMTTYRNIYYPEGRVQIIGPIAESISATDIPPACREAAIVHLCPLAQDVMLDVTTVFGEGLLTATPQGWLRQWNEEGVVSLGGWQKLENILSKLEAAVISLEDIKENWQIAEQWAKQIPILIVTQGEVGCTIFYQDTRQSVPPRPASPTDPTGAGDVFATAFFIRFYETRDLRLSARFANVAASMAIEREGVSGAPTRAEIEAYLAENP